MRIFVRRHGIRKGVQLEGRMVRGDTNVVSLSGLEDARPELIKAGIVLRCFYAIDGSTLRVGLHVGMALGIFAKRKYIYVQRHFAIGNIQNKIGQLRLAVVEGEAEPLEAFQKRVVAVFVRGGYVGAFVGRAIDGLTELEWLSGLPGIVGHGGNQSRPGVTCGDATKCRRKFRSAFARASLKRGSHGTRNSWTNGRVKIQI